MMFDYILVIIADICLGFMLIGNKKYEECAGCSAKSGLLFNAATGFLTALLALSVNRFHFSVTAFSAAFAALQTFTTTAYTMIGFLMLRDGAVSVYSMFLMTGGMVVPFIYGMLFLDEPFSVLRLIGIVLIVSGVLLSDLQAGKNSGKYLALGAVVFLLNGMTSVSSKLHQIETVHPIVPTTEFVILSSLMKGIVSSLILLIFIGIGKTRGNEKNGGINPDILRKCALCILFVAAVNGVSSYCLTRGAINLPATVLYPLNTGGTIVLSAVIERIVYKTKAGKTVLIGIALCVCGTLLFL